MVSYEEWKETRLERVKGRCGGNPTFKGTRLQPHDIIHCRDESDFWGGVTIDDLEHARRFTAEEPHWKILSQGLDAQGREVPEAEYEALRLQYRDGWEAW
jgi:uncharacterized protein (DUF433 family)